jgi:hypothetical protein
VKSDSDPVAADHVLRVVAASPPRSLDLLTSAIGSQRDASRRSGSRPRARQSDRAPCRPATNACGVGLELSGAEHRRDLIPQRIVNGRGTIERNDAADVEATDDRTHRWYHGRASAWRRVDVTGTNDSWRLIVIVAIVALVAWGWRY